MTQAYVPARTSEVHGPLAFVNPGDKNTPKALFLALTDVTLVQRSRSGPQTLDGEARVRAYYDGIAETYEQQLDNATNQAMRSCFWQCAEAVLPKPARILDFGAGSGLDAQHFTALGHRVTAYDASDGMLGILRKRCSEELRSGNLFAVSGPLDQARHAIAERAPFDAILCNFAVFSTIPRLKALFQFFADVGASDGMVLAVIQNPWYPPHFRNRSFWHALAALPLHGTMRYPSAQLGTVFHYRRGQVYRAARPFYVPDRTAARQTCRTCFGPRSNMRLVALRRR